MNHKFPMSKTTTRRRKNWQLIFAITFVFFVSCMPYVKKEKKENLVRVAIVIGADQVMINGIKDNKFYENYQVSLKDTFPFYFNGQQEMVKVNGKPYRGNLEIRNTAGKIWVINVLDIEDYLKGVVPCEIGSLAMNLIEATKAQAVAARTYAYAHLGQYEERGFDLYATVQDQVYNGMKVENDLTDMAIEQTKGEILVFKKQPIDAKYHACCGGRTADCEDAWSGQAPPYLKSRRCSYCEGSPNYEWQKKIDKNVFFSNLRTGLANTGINLSESERIKGIKVTKNRKSGRAKFMIIKTTRQEYRISGYEIRKILGDKQDPGGLLKSNYITFKIKGDIVIIEGKGFGHGVGMCQSGAIEMARKGKSYKEILRYYYSKTKIAHAKS